MERWEYLVSRVQNMVPDDMAELEQAHLNEAGQKGWILVHVANVSTNAKFSMRHYYFKRRLPHVPVQTRRLELPKNS